MTNVDPDGQIWPVAFDTGQIDWRQVLIGAAKTAAGNAIATLNILFGPTISTTANLSPSNRGQQVGAGFALAAAAAIPGANLEDGTASVIIFTSDEAASRIAATGVLKADTYVAVRSEIPPGASSATVEGMLEIAPGKGANSITLDTPKSNLRVPDQGPTTSGGATKYQLNSPPRWTP